VIAHIASLSIEGVLTAALAGGTILVAAPRSRPVRTPITKLSPPHRRRHDSSGQLRGSGRARRPMRSKTLRAVPCRWFRHSALFQAAVAKINPCTEAKADK
jgi:hypothetical protein